MNKDKKNLRRQAKMTENQQITNFGPELWEQFLAPYRAQTRDPRSTAIGLIL